MRKFASSGDALVKTLVSSSRSFVITNSTTVFNLFILKSIRDVALYIQVIPISLKCYPDNNYLFFSSSSNYGNSSGDTYVRYLHSAMIMRFTVDHISRTFRAYNRRDSKAKYLCARKKAPPPPVPPSPPPNAGRCILHCFFPDTIQEQRRSAVGIRVGNRVK